MAKQAAQWILQDLTANAPDFAGKKWRFEHKVANADANASYIDLSSSDIPPRFIEYKWLTTRVVNREDFVREFIKRDLMNIASLDHLQWRIKGYKLTQAKFLEYLGSAEGRKALEALGVEKAKKLFPTSSMNKSDFVELLILNFNNNEIFAKIFK